MRQDQFDERYRLDAYCVDHPGVRRRGQFVADEQRRIQTEIPVRPANIAWFEDLLAQGVAPGDGPVVGVFCNIVPLEIVYALGARPVRAGCGNPALVQSGEEVLSGEICPLAKASFGALIDPQGSVGKCDAFVVPTTCDAKRKLGEVLADFKPTFMMNLPPEQDASRYGKAAAAEIKRLAAFLSDRVGAKLRTGALRREIALGRRRTALVRDLQNARAGKPGALSIRDFFVVVQASFTGVTLEDWLVRARQVLGEVAAYTPPRPRMRPRMVLTGAPMIWPNFKVLNLIEESGADVVADTLCSGAQSCFDPVVADERGRSALFRALAQRYVFASACPCFVSQATRLSRVLELVETCRADGVVNHSLRLCQLFDMETYRLSRVMKARKIPFMNVRTDYSLEDTEQLRVRLEAFLETVGDQA